MKPAIITACIIISLLIVSECSSSVGGIVEMPEYEDE